MDNFFPIKSQLKGYNIQTLKQDSYAGLMVAFLLVPQAIAYAMLAGVPAVNGLYASIFPLFVYSVLGSSALLSVGPVAVVSIMVFTGLAPAASSDEGVFLPLVALLSLTVGLLQILFSVLRFGTLFQYVPAAVLRGFMNALALTIILHQLDPLLGIAFQKKLPFIPTLGDLLRQLSDIQFPILLFSSALLLIYFILRSKGFPSPSLVIVVISAVVVYFFPLKEHGIQLVGTIKAGFPTWEVPELLMSYLPTILPLAFFIALISFLESYTMATQMEKNKKTRIDPNQELFALGLANVTGSCVQAIPVAGAFSRSAVNKDSNAKTSMSSVFSACFVLLLISFFTAPLAYLPHAALAIIIIFAAHKLIHWNSIVTKPLVMITFVSSLVFGLKIGFLTGVGVSILLYWCNKYKSHVF
ncbi:hypothetical protein D7Z54_15710 [Salibacterium salarium]|uniref:SLC26A/SulP transporter domain-containing protein n=1 Tax=Salibacterium salarium TaxID=284579 RepID=A0A428N1M6_9BACI|nr:SulP family inorganic anion transporter [Salibacterium salarium]RSL32341.1 hypothetical protein D7Z54_15710 [Salibacterium salarium]